MNISFKGMTLIKTSNSDTANRLALNIYEPDKNHLAKQVDRDVLYVTGKERTDRKKLITALTDEISKGKTASERDIVNEIIIKKVDDMQKNMCLKSGSVIDISG